MPDPEETPAEEAPAKPPTLSQHHERLVQRDQRRKDRHDALRAQAQEDLDGLPDIPLADGALEKMRQAARDGYATLELPKFGPVCDGCESPLVKCPVVPGILPPKKNPQKISRRGLVCCVGCGAIFGQSPDVKVPKLVDPDAK